MRSLFTSVIIALSFLRPEISIAQNEDFEASAAMTITNSSQVSGWAISGGTNSNTCTFTNCCANQPTASAIIAAPNGYYDSNIQAGIFSVFGSVANSGTSYLPGLSGNAGNNFIRINNMSGGAWIETASKTLTVTLANSLFQFAFMQVTQSGAHQCCDANAFQIRVTNVTANNVLSCPNLFFTIPSVGGCTLSPYMYYNQVSLPTVFYNDWRLAAIDLSSYIGQVIQLDFSANGCVFGGHYDYTYLDAQCTSMTLMSNGAPVSLVNSSATVSTCGNGSVTLTAPTGLGPYAWIGPGSNPQQSNMQTFVTSAPGTYTLTMNPLGACTPLIKTITVNAGTAPLPLAIAGPTAACVTTGASFSVSGASTYSWNTGATTNTIVVTPSLNTMYYVSGIDLNNCVSKDSIQLTILPSPTLSALGSGSVCLGSSMTFTLLGASSFSWNGGAVSSTVNVMPQVSTNYSVIGLSNNCADTLTVYLYVDPNCSNVWPGDANSDGVANNLDVLELGLHIAQTGAPRTSVSNIWNSWYASNWSGSISNGKNICQSDCNGDGVIDLSDTAAILLNYNFTHTFKAASSTSINPQLYLVPDQSFVDAGQWGSASVFLGDSANSISDLNGVAFTLDFDNTFVQTDSIYMSYPASFFNVNNNNLNFIDKVYPNAVVYSASTHTTNITIAGNGKIATFFFKVISSLGMDTVINLSPVLAFKSNASGFLTALTTGTINVPIKAINVGLKVNASSGGVTIYPNPTNRFIRIDTEKELQKIEVLNLEGKILMTENGKEATHLISLALLQDDMYILKIYTKDQVPYIQKVFLNTK